MAHFYGTLQGNRGEATRMGHKGSGITTYTASWEGAIRVYAYYDEEKKQDFVVVSKTAWHGRGDSKELYHGPIGV